MEEAKQIPDNNFYHFTGLAIIVSFGVSVGVGWIIKTLKSNSYKLQL